MYKNKSKSKYVLHHHVTHSISLEHIWWRKLSLEDTIPEATGDSKTVLVICKVMLQVILLELAVVRWEAARCC